MSTPRSLHTQDIIIPTSDLPEQTRVRCPVKDYNEVAEVDVLLVTAQEWNRLPERKSPNWKTVTKGGLVIAIRVSFDPRESKLV